MEPENSDEGLIHVEVHCLYLISEREAPMTWLVEDPFPNDIRLK